MRTVVDNLKIAKLEIEVWSAEKLELVEGSYDLIATLTCCAGLSATMVVVAAILRAF